MMGHLKMVTSLTNRLLSQVIKCSEYQTFVCFTVLRYPKYWVMYSIHSTLSMVGDLKFDHMKSGLFESHISNGPVFNWSGFSFGYSFSPNHSKTGPFEILTFFCLDFKLFLTKWLPFVRISVFIQNPDNLQPNLFLII